MSEQQQGLQRQAHRPVLPGRVPGPRVRHLGVPRGAGGVAAEAGRAGGGGPDAAEPVILLLPYPQAGWLAGRGRLVGGAWVWVWVWVSGGGMSVSVAAAVTVDAYISGQGLGAPATAPARAPGLMRPTTAHATARCPGPAVHMCISYLGAVSRGALRILTGH